MSILNWVLPAWMTRKLTPMPVNEVEEAVAKASEGDRTFRALLQLAGEQWEQANFEALHEDLTPEQRIYKAGRAAASMDYLLNIERIRQQGKAKG